MTRHLLRIDVVKFSSQKKTFTESLSSRENYPASQTDADLHCHVCNAVNMHTAINI